MSQMFDVNADMNDDISGCLPTFYYKTVLDKKMTAETGCDHFKEQEWIRIRIRGDNTVEIDTGVTEEHRKKYALSYANFKAGTDQKIGDGYPLEQWAMIGAPMVKTLHGLDIYTVEQLAGFPDTMIHRLHQGQTYKQRAIKWLAERSGDGNADLRNEVERLTALVAKMQTVQTKKKRKKRTVRRAKGSVQSAPESHPTE